MQGIQQMHSSPHLHTFVAAFAHIHHCMQMHSSPCEHAFNATWKSVSLHKAVYILGVHGKKCSPQAPETRGFPDKSGYNLDK